MSNCCGSHGGKDCGSQLNLDYQLNKYVANLHVFHTKVHNLHWNLEGDNFFVIHPMFDDVMAEILEHIDIIAERVRQIGCRPYASLKVFLAHTIIEELDSKAYTCDEAIKYVYEDFKLLLTEVNELMRLCEDKNDQETLDDLIAIGKAYQKHIWMYGAYLGK